MLSLDTLKASVNLYTGTVAFPMNLVQLDGLGGLDTTVRLLYDSTVRQNARTNNLERSTGIVGLGWGLDTELIFVDNNQNGNDADNDYYYFANGSASRLVPVSENAGVISFQLADFQFWQITYTTATEEWTVVKDDGVRTTFGGGATGSPQTSTGDSVQWGVRWGSWYGPSAETSGQSQFALIWNRSRVEDHYGNAMSYTYTGYADDQVAVGTGGLPYTRASYLRSITDSVGRTVVFKYGTKSSTGNQIEYVAPHSGPLNQPNAYQERYETRFLSCVVVYPVGATPTLDDNCANRSGAQSSLSFGYHLEGQGDLAKRYLTSVTELNGDGDSLPSTKLSYRYTDGGGHPLGFLETVTLPSGGMVDYTYTSQAAALSERDLSIKEGYSQPRFWFDTDYAVVTWLDTASQDLRIFTYIWNGRWVEHDDYQIAILPTEYQQIRVLTARDQFAILRPFPDGSYTLTPYRRSVTEPGSWIIGSSTRMTGLTAHEPVVTAVGDTYFAVLGTTSGQLYRFHWNGAAFVPTGPTQLSPHTSHTRFALAGKHAYLMAGACEEDTSGAKMHLYLYHLDRFGSWSNPTTAQTVRPVSNLDQLSFYAGDSFVIAKSTDEGLTYNDYNYRAYTWTTDYGAITDTSLKDTSQFSDSYADAEPAIRGGLVGLNVYSFRFDGNSWHEQDLNAAAFRYPNQNLPGTTLAYGFDEAVRRTTVTSGGTPDYNYDLGVFYPSSTSWNVNSFAGASLPSDQTINWSLVPISATTARFPSQYALVYDTLYYGHPDGSWTSAGVTIPTSVVRSAPASIQLLGSNYLTYQDGADAVVIPLENGGALPPIRLPNQSVYDGASGAEQLIGLSAFCTYTGSLSNPNDLTLHRLVEDAVLGTVSAYVATVMTVDSGFDTYPTCFDYDTTKAVVDVTGQVALHNQVSSAAGVASFSPHAYGYSSFSFFNGLSSTESLHPFPDDPSASNAQDHYGRLGGRVYRQEDHDSSGAPVAVTDFYFEVYSQHLANVATAYYNRVTKTSNTVDGVLSERQLTYSGGTGLVTAQTSANYDAAGNLHTIVERFAYAGDTYPGLATLNVRTPVVQTTVQDTTGSTTVNRRVEVTTWRVFSNGRWAPNKTYRAITDTAAFDFNAWSGNGANDEPPTNQWLRTSKVTVLGDDGSPLQTIDVDDRPASHLVSASGGLRVATFANADVAAQEAGYFGFEPYESPGPWQIKSGGQTTTANSYTGSTCLAVAPAAQLTKAVEAVFSPTTTTTAFVFSAWVNAQHGFGNDGGSAYVQVSQSGGGPSTRIDIPATEGDWQYVQGAVDLASAGAVVTIDVYTNKPTTSYWLDNLRFAPAAAALDARVYDLPRGVVVASLGPNFETHRYLHDAFGREQVTTGPSGEVQDVTLVYSSRQVDDTPTSQSSPNVSTSLRARTGGTVEIFTDTWANDWTASPASDWSVAGRSLVHAGTTAGTATYVHTPSASSYGVRVMVEPNGAAAPTGTVGLTIGTVSVSWQPTGSGDQGHWYLGTTRMTTPPGGAFPYARDWVLLVVDSRVLFFAGGGKIIDTMPTGGAVGGLVLEASADVRFRDLALITEPQVTLGYFDGAGNTRQVQTMALASTVIVGETLYDALARPAIEAKPSTISVGASSNPMFDYRSNYVTNGGAAGSLWTTGQMQGQILTYHPTDGAYPYSRKAFEDSPLGRVVAVGLAGSTFAVGNKDTRYVYTTAQPNNPLGLPANHCFVVETTDADGVVSTTAVDLQGDILARSTGPIRTGSSDLQTTTYLRSWSSTGLTIEVQTPNYHVPPAAGADPNAFVLTQHYDFLGRLASAASSDTGTTSYRYDGAGRLRFMLDADGAQGGGNDHFRYYAFGALGQPSDVGLVTGTWSSLPPVIPPGYSATGTAEVRQRWTYFDASSTFLGQLREVEQLAAGGAVDVTESYTYQDDGALHTMSTQVPGFDTQTYTTTYEVDNLGNVTRIVYPDTASTTVVYAYDRRGLMQNVGSTTSPSLYANYTYLPNGSIDKESLGFNGSTNVPHTYTYNAPGWLTSVQYNTYSQSLIYDQPAGSGYGGATYFNGLLALSSIAYRFTNAPSSYNYAYGYDNLGRVLFAQNSGAVAWGLGVSGGVDYDANGNIHYLNRGNDQLTYTYRGTNQASDQVASLSGSVSQTFGYNEAGAITSAPSTIQQITYDPLTGRPTSITAGAGAGTNLAFQYGANGKRALKTVTSSSGTTKKLYLYGVDDQPIMARIDDGNTTETIRYIQSINGLIATENGGTRYYVIKDHQGSTRVLFDSQGNVGATFDYMPYGGLFRTSGDPSLMCYRYTGQEWDDFSTTLNDGLYNYNARLYDPVSARFYGPDPRWQYPSPYVYVGDNPVQLIDPSGEISDVLLAALELLGAAAAGALVGAFIAPAAGFLLVGAVIGGRIVGGTYAIATGMEGTDAIDYANATGVSFGVAATAGYAGASFGAAVGMSRLSIGISEFFGVVNGFSIMPEDTQISQYGYYVAAGLAISFGTEALANTVVARTAGVGFAEVEATVEGSNRVTALQRGVSNTVTGFVTGTTGGLLRGDDVSASLERGVGFAYFYGVGSFFSAWFFRGQGALVSNTVLQHTLEKTTKQAFVMTNQEIFHSREDKFLSGVAWLRGWF